MVLNQFTVDVDFAHLVNCPEVQMNQTLIESFWKGKGSVIVQYLIRLQDVIYT